MGISPATCRVQLFASTVNAPIRWRLLGTNNREIGRGAESFADAESCRLAVKELQTQIDDVDAVVRRGVRNSWVWHLVLDDRLVATSAHGYDRQIRCGAALSHFRDGVRTAGISAEVMTSYARRWGGAIA